MAKRSQRPVEPFWYVLAGDRQLPANEQSRWKFRPLTQSERLEFLDNAEVVTEDGTGSRQLRFRSFTQAREIVLLTLVDVENFPAGEPLPLPKGATRADKAKYIENVEDSAVYELGQHVFDHSTLGTDSKNS